MNYYLLYNACFMTLILGGYREVLCDEVEQLGPFPFLTSCVWHQYFQWQQDVNLGYDLHTSDI